MTALHLKFTNVNQAFYGLVQGLHSKTIHGEKQSSRNGLVLRATEPILATYKHPKERVLLNPYRNANPFFHLFEALWMLSGLNDLAPIARIMSRYADYSDDGYTLNGAYGYRWRFAAISEDGNNGKGQRQDQLKLLIDHLKHNPNSRRAVLQMWNVKDDLLKIGGFPDDSSKHFNDKDFPGSKDVCCNTAAYLAIRQEEVPGIDPTTGEVSTEGSWVKLVDVLDITVTNRSNDLIWGMLGSDYVTFSILQEYVASCLGISVGLYHQFTNNLHVYTDNNSGWNPELWLQHSIDEYTDFSIGYQVPLVTNPQVFDREVLEFINSPESHFEEPFLETVAKPVTCAYLEHKNKNARRRDFWCNQIQNDDWKLACQLWFERKKK